MAISRRGLLGALIAAPAIVRVSSLMPVKAYYNEAAILALLELRMAEAQEAMLKSIYLSMWDTTTIPAILGIESLLKDKAEGDTVGPPSIPYILPVGR